MKQFVRIKMTALARCIKASFHKWVLTVCCGVCTLQLGATCANSAPLYTIQDLGVVGREVDEVSINDHGQVTVSTLSQGSPLSQTPNGEAYLISNGTSTSLGTLGGTTQANDINSAGVVVGWSGGAVTPQHSIMYSAGQLIDLGSLGSVGSVAYAINDHGDIAGEEFSLGSSLGYIRRSDGSLGLIDAGMYTYTRPFDISNSGLVVGSTGDGVSGQAFAFDGNAIISLGSLGGLNSSANAVNGSNQIVGQAFTSFLTADGQRHATLFSLTGSPVNLDPGYTSTALDINDAGQIVGLAEIPNVGQRATMFRVGQPAVNLQDLIPADSGWASLYAATGINNVGQIVGTGYISDVPGLHAFLMTPVPEPSVALLCAVLPFVLTWPGVRMRRLRR